MFSVWFSVSFYDDPLILLMCNLNWSLQKLFKEKMYEKVQRNPSFFILLDSKNYTDTKLFNHNFLYFTTCSWTCFGHKVADFFLLLVSFLCQSVPWPPLDQLLEACLQFPGPSTQKRSIWINIKVDRTLNKTYLGFQILFDVSHFIFNGLSMFVVSFFFTVGTDNLSFYCS